MARNIVLLTSMDKAPDTLDYKEWCFDSWKHWCQKHEVDLIVLEQEIVPVSQMKPTWQRWHALDILDEQGIDYDQVALVDLDTLIHPNAPNFFELTNHGFTVVGEDTMIEWIHNSIRGYQDMFPDVHFDWTTYWNNGFIVINRKHAELCRSITQFYYDHQAELQQRQHHTLRKGSDQTPVNYLVRQAGVPITYLPKTWNLTHMHMRGVINTPIMAECGWVYHYNGFEKTMRNRLMQQGWEMLKAKFV